MRGTENLHDLILSIPMYTYRHVHIIRRRFKSEDLLASQSQKIPRIPPQDFNQAWQFWRRQLLGQINFCTNTLEAKRHQSTNNSVI